MRITEDGQVTIPQAIRDRLGVGPGSEVDFVERGDAVVVLRREDEAATGLKRAQVEAHIQAMRGTIDTMGMDGKEFVDWLRGPRDDAVDPR